MKGNVKKIFGDALGKTKSAKKSSGAPTWQGKLGNPLKK